MLLPEQLLLSDLLARRVRDSSGEDQGLGVLGWMHPPVHRLLGWATRPSPLSPRRGVWRLDQLRALTDSEALVRGAAAETDTTTLERLPTLLGAVLFGAAGQPLGRLVDAAVELSSGRILYYLVARSDPRLPGGSRWRLTPDRLLDQRPGEVVTALEGLADLPLAHASVREALLRRSRRWRQQWGEESSRWREQWQHTSGRLEEKLEGWLEEPPWQAPSREPHSRRQPPDSDDLWPSEPWPDEPLEGYPDGRAGGRHDASRDGRPAVVPSDQLQDGGLEDAVSAHLIGRDHSRPSPSPWDDDDRGSQEPLWGDRAEVPTASRQDAHRRPPVPSSAPGEEEDIWPQDPWPEDRLEPPDAFPEGRRGRSSFEEPAARRRDPGQPRRRLDLSPRPTSADDDDPWV